MKKVIVEFYFNGGYINTDHYEDVEFEFPEEYTEEEMENEIVEALTQWLYERSDASYRIKD